MEPVLAQARQDLPSVPEEVFQLWLDECIHAHGWPPVGSAWERSLAGISLEYLQSLRWVKDYVALNPADLGPRSLDRAVRILDANVHGKENEVIGSIADSPKRFASIWEFINSNSTLPVPLVMVSTLEGYEVVEGHHRIAAMLWTGAQKRKEGFFPGQVQAWIGAIRA